MWILKRLCDVTITDFGLATVSRFKRAYNDGLYSVGSEGSPSVLAVAQQVVVWNILTLEEADTAIASLLATKGLTEPLKRRPDDDPEEARLIRLRAIISSAAAQWALDNRPAIRTIFTSARFRVCSQQSGYAYNTVPM